MSGNQYLYVRDTLCLQTDTVFTSAIEESLAGLGVDESALNTVAELRVCPLHGETHGGISAIGVVLKIERIHGQTKEVLTERVDIHRAAHEASREYFYRYKEENNLL